MIIRKNRVRSNYSFININLLGVCNLNCFFCLGKDLYDEFLGHDCLNEHFLNWPNFEKCLSICEENSIHNIYLTGQNTDPLLYSYLSDLVEYLKDRGFRVGIRTNGITAIAHLPVINRLDSVGYSILTLDSRTQRLITGNAVVPEWDYILKNTNVHKRVSIVVCRYNHEEIESLIEWLSNYDISYIQLRRISTDTRYEWMKEDIAVFETKVDELTKKYGIDGSFEAAPTVTMFGKEVVFWRTVETTANSMNYFTNGVISDEYFIVEGYLKNKEKREKYVQC